MLLHDFISSSLLSIAKGIHDANNGFEEPPFYLVGGEGGTIDFEIHVTAEDLDTDSSEAGGKFGAISVFSLGANLKHQNIQRDLRLHSIRFSVKPAERYYFEK